MSSAMTMMQSKLDQHNVVDKVEDNIDSLLARLEGQVGKKVKILTEEEEAAELQKQKEKDLEIQEAMEKIENERQLINQDKQLIETEL